MKSVESYEKRMELKALNFRRLRMQNIRRGRIFNVPTSSHHENIICLTGKPGDVLHPFRACSEVVLMSTYEELSLIVSVALLIVAILNLKNKK